MKHRARTSSVASSPTCRSSAQTTVDRRPNHNTARGTPRSTSISINTNTTNNNKKTSAAHTSPASKRGKNLPAGRGLNGSALREHLPPPLKYWPLLTQTQRRNAMDLSRRAAATTSRRDTNNNNNNNSSAPPLPSTNTNTNNNNNNNSSNNGSSALSDDPQAFLDLLRLIKSMCCRVDPTEVASSTSLVLRGDGGASSPTKSANAHDGKHTTTHFSPARVGKLGGATNQVDHPTTTTSSSSVVMAPTKRSGGVGVVGVGATTGMPSTCGEAEMILWRLEEAQEALFPSPLATSGGVRLLPSKLPSIVPLRRSVSNNTIPPPTTTTNNVSAEMMNMMMMRGKGSTTTTTANVGAMVPRRKVWKVFIRDRTSAFSMLMAAARSEVVCADVRIAATLLTLIYNITRSLPMEVQRTSIRQCERLGLAKACGAVVRTCSAIPSTHTDCITINGHTGAALHIRAVESAGLLLALCASYSNNTSVFVRLSRGLSKLMQAAEMLASMVEQKLSNYRTLSDFDCSAATPHHKTNNNNNNNNVNGCVDGNNNNSGEASQRTRTTEAVLRLRDCTTPFTNPLLHMLLALFALCRSAATAQELGPRCAALCARSIATTSAFIIHTAPKLLHVMAIRGQDNNNSSGVLRCTTSGEHLEEVGGTFISISVASWLRHLELLTFWSAALLHRITSQASSSRVACSEAAMQCGAITSLFDIIAGTSNNNNNNKTSVEASTSILSVAPQPATTTTTTSSSSLTHRVVRSLRHPQLVHAALLAMESVVSGSRTRGVAEINKMGGLHVVAQHILSLPDRSLEELHRDYLQLCSLHNLRQLPAPDEVDPNAVNQRLPDHLRPRPPPRGTTTSRPTPNINNNNNNNNNMSEAASTTDAELANIEGGTMEVFDVDAHVDWLSPELRGGVVAAPTMLPEMHHCPLPWSFTAVGPPPMLRWMDEDDAHQHDGERLRPSTMEERKAVIRRQIHRLAQGPPADEMMSSGGGGETLPRHNIVFERDGAEVEVVADAAAASASTPPLHNNNNNSSSSSYTTPQLVFASNFESGNLQRALRVGDDVYDLLLSFDTATNSFVQWFCFAISSYVPGHTYHFTILNLEKTSSTFNEGQLPLLLHVPSSSSSSSSSLGGGAAAAAAADDVDVVVADGGDAPRWQRTGEGVFYYQNSYERPPRNTLFPKKMVVGSASNNNNNNNNTSMSTIINANNSNSNNTSMSGRGGGTLDEGGSPLMPAKPRGNAPTTFPRRLGGSLNASTRTASPSRPPRSSLHGNKMPVGKRGSAAANTRRAAAGAATTSSPSLAGGGGSGVGSPTSCRSSNTNTTRKAASSSYYSLSFSITMPPAGGVVYLANCLPYTYTELRLHMQQLQKTLAPTCASSTQQQPQQQQQHSRGTPSLHSSRSPSPSRGTTEDLTQMMASSSTATHNNNNNSARGSSTTHAASPLMVQMLCRSTGGLPIPLLTLTNLIRRDTGELYATEDVQRRPVCVLVARVHPGESNSSWVMNGILDCLVAGARHLQQQQQQQQQKRGVVGVASGDDVVRDEAQHKQQPPPPQQQHDEDASTCAWAADLLDHFVFKIVPMLNVDGVVMGNHRCSLYGVDLNRDYLAPRSNINPVLYAVKQLIRYLTTREQRHVIMYADFHGHSRAKNFLLYGCTNTRTQKRTPANNNNKQQHRVSEAGSVGGGDALAATTNSTTNTSTAAAGSSIHDTTNNMSAAQSSSTTCVPTSSSSSWLAISPEKLFPSLLAHMNYAFNIAQNNFAMQKSKRSSGRVVMYREFGIRMSYGVEGTMMGGRGAIGVLPRPSSSPSPTTTATTTTTPMMMMQKSIYADVPNYSTISDEAPYYTSTYRYFGATFVAALAMLLKMERDVNRAAVVAAAGEYADELDGVGDGVVHDGDDVHGQQQQQQHQQHAMMMEAVATRAWAMTATAGTSKAPPVLSYSDGSMMAMSSNCNTRTTTNNNNNVPTHGVPLQQQREILFGLLRGNQQEMEELSDDDDDASVGGDSDDGDGATSTGGRSGRGGANSSGADAEASTSAANEACSSVEGSDDADDDDDDEGDDEVDDDDDSAWMDAPCETFDGDLPDSLNDML